MITKFIAGLAILIGAFFLVSTLIHVIIAGVIGMTVILALGAGAKFVLMPPKQKELT